MPILKKSFKKLSQCFGIGVLIVAVLACRAPGEIGKQDLNSGEAMHMFYAACEQRKDPATLGMVYNAEQDAWYHKTQLVSVKIHSDKLCTMAFGSADDPKMLEFMLRGKGAEEFDIDGGAYEDQVLYIAADIK